MEIFSDYFEIPNLLNVDNFAAAQFVWAPSNDQTVVSNDFTSFAVTTTTSPAIPNSHQVDSFTIVSSTKPFHMMAASHWEHHDSTSSFSSNSGSMVETQENSLPSSPSSSSDNSTYELDSSLSFNVGSFEAPAPMAVSSSTQRVPVKGRPSGSGASARVRKTIRPKVIESKGTMQCAGRNRKKGTQCRNAALMEHIGPKPIYCAEHIELDPQSLYEKCKAGYQKERGDGKNCKEVVLKEFGLCYKHFPDLLTNMIQEDRLDKVRHTAVRVGELLAQLEHEAAVAKKTDADLYQRKNKLIPKFQEMKKIVLRFLQDIGDSELYEQLLNGEFESHHESELDELVDPDQELLSDETCPSDQSSTPLHSSTEIQNPSLVKSENDQQSQ